MSESAKPKSPQGGWKPVPRHGWARAAGETVLGEAKSAFARAGFPDPTLVLRWATIAGPAIARIAQPVKWQEGKEGATITLKCEAGAAVLLQHETRALIERLNAYLGAGRVARLKLVPGRFSQASEPPGHPAPAAEPPGESSALPEALDRLARLRARLKPMRPKRPN
jgi:hypothetical protein